MSSITEIILNGTTYSLGGSGTGLTADLKAALDQLAQKVAYIDADGQTYYTALYNALYPPANLVSISVVYTQSGVVYDTDQLNNLKSDLVVTAHMSDGTTQIVTAYTLSGTLTAGTSIITVSYGGKTTTFTVVVTHVDNSLYNWDFTQGIVDSKQGVSATIGSGVTQGSNGLTFDGTVDGWVYLTSMLEYASSAYTVEVDVTSITKGASPSVFINLNSAADLTGNPCGIFFNTDWYAKTTDNSNGAIGTDLTDISTFNGHTFKFQCDYANKVWNIYKDNVLFGSCTAYQTANGKHQLGLGATPSRYIGQTVITGVRIYEGVV